MLADSAPGAPDSHGDRSSTQFRWQSTLTLTLLPFASSLAVVLIGIGSHPLWRDEHATWWAASLSLGDLRRLLTEFDAAMALYYLLMHAWVWAFGDSEASLRLPSALFVALAATFTALVGRRVFGANAGLVAGILLPLVPSISFYGQNARPYALTLFATVLAVWLLLRALDRPGIGRWLGYAAAIAVVAVSHLVALLVLPAHLVLVLAAQRRRTFEDPGHWWLKPLAGWTGSLLLAMTAMLPLIMLSRSQLGQLLWVPDATFQQVLRLPVAMFGSTAIAGFFVIAGVFMLLVLAMSRGRRSGALFFTLWIIFPPLLAYLTFDHLRLFVPRYFLFTLPAWVLLGGHLLAGAALRSRQLVAGSLAVVGAMIYLGFPAQVEIRAGAWGDEASFQQAANFVAEQAEIRDGIVFTGYDYAHRGFRYEWRHIPPTEQPIEVLVDQSSTDAYSWKQPACVDAAACLAGTGRIWLVSVDPTGSPLDLLPAAQRRVVAGQFAPVGTTRFHRIWVTELVRKPSG